MSKRPSLADSLRQAVQEEPASAPIPAAPVTQPSAPTPQPGAPAARSSGFYAATRAGKKKVTAALDTTMHKQFKSLAVEREATTEALLVEAISDLLTKYGRAIAGGN